MAEERRINVFAGTVRLEDSISASFEGEGRARENGDHSFGGGGGDKTEAGSHELHV